MAPQVGLEPTTLRLTEQFSTQYQRLTRNGWQPKVLIRNDGQFLLWGYCGVVGLSSLPCCLHRKRPNGRQSRPESHSRHTLFAEPAPVTFERCGFCLDSVFCACLTLFPVPQRLSQRKSLFVQWLNSYSTTWRTSHGTDDFCSINLFD